MIEGNPSDNLRAANRIIEAVRHFQQPALAVQMLIFAAVLIMRSNELDLDFLRMWREAEDYLRMVRQKAVREGITEEIVANLRGEIKPALDS